MVEVTQADREAAIKIFAMIFGNGHSATYALARSDRHFLFDELARHRIAAENAALERAAKVADELGGVRPKTADQEPFRAQHTRANTIATAIRAMKGPSNG